MQDTLNLPVGATVQLQLTLPENAPRELVRVIGYLPEASLVVSAPTNAEGKFKIVREGQVYKVRMLRGDSVVGFESRVLAAPVKPYPHLHLQYPREVEQIVVRSSARVVTDLACRVRNTAQPDSAEHFHPARIVDLSETGARVAAEAPLGEPGDMLQLVFGLDVLDKQEELSLVGDLRGVNERRRRAGETTQVQHHHGVQFRAVNRFQQVLLHAWVMERLANGGGDLG